MTAEELSVKYFSGMHYEDITIEHIQKYAIEFARLKGKEILEAAVYNAGVKTIKIPINGEEGTFEIDVVDEDTILNAYDLNNIK